MRTATFLAVLLFGCALSGLHSQPLVLLQAAAPRTSVIEGVVKGGNAEKPPLSNARVELLSGPNTPIVVRSDGVGRFVFGNLAAGAYQMRVTRDGFLRQEYGARSFGMPGSAIKVAAGQRVTDIEFRLTPASTVSGTVTDDHGEPLPGVLVQALRSGYDPRGNPILRPSFFAFTDDLGRYRLFWIDPGDYVVSATAMPDIGETLDFRQVRVGLVPLNADLASPPAAGIQPDGKFALDRVETGVYLLDLSGLPGNAYMAAARIGDVDILQKDVSIGGAPASTLEILLKVDGGSLAGTILDAAGKPAAGAQMVLVPDAERRRPDQYRAAFADEGGRFSVRGIPPGEYTAYTWERIEPYAFLNSDFIARYGEAAIHVRIAPGVNPETNLRAINSAR